MLGLTRCLSERAGCIVWSFLSPHFFVSFSLFTSFFLIIFFAVSFCSHSALRLPPSYYAAADAKERLANQAAGHGLKTNAEVAAEAALDAAAAQAKQDAAASQAKTDAVAAQYDAAQGLTALMEAARSGLTATMQAHLDADASIDQQDADGFTALHFASYNNHPSAVMLLLAHNADPSIKQAFGDTALDIAKEEGHVEVITILASPAKVSLLNPIISQARRAHRTIA